MYNNSNSPLNHLAANALAFAAGAIGVLAGHAYGRYVHRQLRSVAAPAEGKSGKASQQAVR